MECPQCGEDRLCRKPVEREGQACKLHGGNSLKGISAPNYQGKGYSKYMPADQMVKFIDFRQDQDMLSLEDEIALLRSMAVERLSSGSIMELFEDLKKLYTKAKVASLTDPDNFVDLFDQMGEVITKGDEIRISEGKLLRIMENIRRNVDTQRQIYVDRGQLITQGTVLLMWDEILRAIREHIAPLEGSANAIREIVTVIGRFTGNVGNDR